MVQRWSGDHIADVGNRCRDRNSANGFDLCPLGRRDPAKGVGEVVVADEIVLSSLSHPPHQLDVRGCRRRAETPRRRYPGQRADWSGRRP